ncbi:MAG: phytanoyl-CoA dioxygenase family protein [Planctomycetota bacterium]
MPKVLSQDQVERFRSQGYLLPPEPIFNPARFQALCDYFEELQERWRIHTGRPIEEMDKTHFWDTRLFDWAADEHLLDLVEDIVGPDITLFSTHFIAKPPGSGKRVPWHEDSGYWRTLWDPMDVVTVWLAIDPSTRANGCMQVIPGSQVNGYSDYEAVEDAAGNVFPTRIRSDQMDESRAVALELEPNHCSLHHARIIHGSEPNTSDQRRCGLTMRYVGSQARWLAEDRHRHHRNYALRGRIHHDNAYAEPGSINRAFVEHVGFTALCSTPSS